MKKQYIIGAFIICITFTSCEDIDTQSYISILASLMGVCVALIGVCATIIVGFQIASHLDIHDTKKQMESVKVESENVQKDKKEIQEKIEFLETNLANAFVILSDTSDSTVVRCLAGMTSIYCANYKAKDADILFNRYKSLLEDLNKVSSADKRALSKYATKLKNANIPSDIDHYTEIIGLHAEILKTLEEAAKEQND